MNVHLTVHVPPSPDLNDVMQRFQAKLEPLLAAFQPELVQLQGRLERHTSRVGVHCRLNLHLPTGQLSAESTAETAQMAFRGAGEELVRQVHKHKQRLREARPRQRITAHAPAPANGRRLPPSAAANANAERRRQELAAYFGGHYDHLLAFIRRQIELADRLGEANPPGAASLDAQEVLDEVVLAALEAEPGAAQRNRGRWLRLLAAAAMRRLHRSYGAERHGVEVAALEADPLAADEPDPEELARLNEMMQQLTSALLLLPPPQRHDVVLHLLEGFQPRELARLSRRSPAEVTASLREAATRLGAEPHLPVSLKQRLWRGLEAAS